MLGAVSFAYVVRLTRSSIAENLSADYVRTATAKGLSRPRVILVHVLRNSLIPVVTVLGPVVANLITGSFVIGAFGTLTLAHGRYPVSEEVRLFVMIGLCGGYTTFSSFSLQTLDLLRTGAPVRAAVNVGASIVLCVAAVALGHLIGAHFNRGAVEIAQIPIEEEI